MNLFFAVVSATATSSPSPAPPASGWELANQWAIIVSLIGFPLGLMGLIFTFFEARRSAKRSQEAKTASQSAQQAVRDFRQDLRIVSTVADFTKALSITGEIKRLIRHRAFVPLPDRLSEMRELLISIRSNNDLSQEHESVFQSAIVNFRNLENQIDTFISTKTEPTATADMTEVISQDVDSLQEILSSMKQQIGVIKNDTG